jgi:two-component system, OmpR family, sensor histidine kinase VanS
MSRSLSRILRLPAPTVRLRLTLLYSGLFILSGAALLVATYLIFRTNSGVDLIVPNGASLPSDPEALRQVQRMYEASVARNSHGLHLGLIESGIALAIMTLVSIALGWLVAGRVLAPLRSMTAATRRISERNLNERLALPGPRDELKDLADTIDGLLARLQDHVAEQQRFAANASHELRTPLSLTQTLLEVAREDPGRDTGELLDRLHEVNTRAIALTEALLTLSRADQRAITSDRVDLSLMAEEAAETLLPLAEKHGVTIEVSGDPAPTLGSHALLLQLTTNLLHNAIVHNLPEHGTVWVTTAAHPDGMVLTVENTGEQLAPELVSTLVEPFQRGTQRIHTEHTGVGLGLAIVNRIVHAHDGTLTLAARSAGGLCLRVELPTAPAHQADDHHGTAATSATSSAS